MDAQVAEFVAVTGADTATAKQFLEMTGGEVQAAITLFLDMGGPTSSAPEPAPSLPPMSRHASRSYSDEFQDEPDSVRAPDSVKRQRLMNAPADFVSNSSVPQRPVAHAFLEFNRQESRKVDPRMKNLADIFRQPREIMFLGSFNEARVKAKSSKQWLLVNIQDAQDFDSCRMNRDTWSDDTVQNLVTSSFIFWQQPSTSAEGDKFCKLYHVDKFPYIGILDYRTGRMMWSQSGFMGAEAMMLKLMDFSDQHSTEESTGAPANKSVAGASAPTVGSSRPATGSSSAAAGASSHVGNGTDASAKSQPSPAPTASLPRPPVAAAGAKESFEDFDLGREPTETGSRIMFKMPNGAKNVVRRFNKQNPVEALFKFVAMQLASSNETSRFDIIETFPPRRSLRTLLRTCKTLEELSLLNVKLTVVQST